MQNVERLINKFIPENYKLSLKIDRVNRHFSGVISIAGIIQNSTKMIKLHQKDLSIDSIIVDGKSVKYSVAKNAIIINTEQLKPEKHIVTISYSGKINDTMHGMYPCYYEHEGIKKELIATQFESHHAREVLPCIDEPEAKATFDITLSTEKNVVVLGNMPIKYQREENEWLVTCFETTPRMSSYLLAWVVGELHSKSAITKDGIQINVWATPSQNQNNLDFALDIATRSTEFFNDYFKTKYPLTKCDHVALPDFSAGAMENWGLITYREMALLADPKNISIASKRYIATVIAHEISHQWFGNLVTMKWWNDLWLNESFASLIEYTAINALEPNWKVWLDFATFDSIIALKRDALNGVQPVQIDVNHPDEISTLFDGAIVYAKGARLLQMLQTYIGEENFRNGLKQYFDKYAYSSTSDKDLWSIFSKTSNFDIESFMHPWLSQPGFPVLHVTKKGSKMSLSQNKLQNINLDRSDIVWPIPLNSNCDEAPILFKEKSIEFDCDNQKVIRFNIGSTAHFVTHYDELLLHGILDLVEQNKLSTIDRLQLLSEQSLLANAGVISSAKLITILKAYKNETDDSVWDVIGLVISDLKRFASIDEDIEKKLKSFVESISIEQYQRLGWNSLLDEPENDTKLRSTILGLMAYSGNSNVVIEAQNIFNSKNILEIDSEIRSLVISVVVRESNDENLFDNLLKIYHTTNSIELKQDINLGLTSTRNKKLINKLLRTLKNTSLIKIQDTSRWIVYLLKNKYAQEDMWQWIRKNWSWLEEIFGEDKSYDDIPRYVANCLFSNRHLEEFKDFFIPLRQQPALTRAIDIGINELINRVELLARDKKDVKKILKNL